MEIYQGDSRCVTGLLSSIIPSKPFFSQFLISLPPLEGHLGQNAVFAVEKHFTYFLALFDRMIPQQTWTLLYILQPLMGVSLTLRNTQEMQLSKATVVHWSCMAP